MLFVKFCHLRNVELVLVSTYCDLTPQLVRQSSPSYLVSGHYGSPQKKAVIFANYSIVQKLFLVSKRGGCVCVCVSSKNFTPQKPIL